MITKCDNPKVQDKTNCQFYLVGDCIFPQKLECPLGEPFCTGVCQLLCSYYNGGCGYPFIGKIKAEPDKI